VRWRLGPRALPWAEYVAAPLALHEGLSPPVEEVAGPICAKALLPARTEAPPGKIATARQPRYRTTNPSIVMLYVTYWVHRSEVIAMFPSASVAGAGPKGWANVNPSPAAPGV